MSGITSKNLEPILSVIVNAHHEGPLILPTLRSVSAAAAKVSYPCELVVILDNADSVTEALVNNYDRSKPWSCSQLIYTKHGDSAAARNAGVEHARGTYVAVIDGDDLISENYFESAIQLLQSSPGVIAHPEVIISFGARDVVWIVRSSLGFGLSHRLLLEHNLWPSSHVARRDLLKSVPYSSMPPREGFGPEDWYWNVITVAQGIHHVPVPETVFFYRVKSTAGINVQHANSILPQLPLAQLKRVLPGVEGFAYRQTVDYEFENNTRWRIRRAFAHTKKLVRPVVKALTWWLNPKIVSILFSPINRTYQLLLVRQNESEYLPVEIARARKQFKAAVEIEPALSNALERVVSTHLWLIQESQFAVILDTILRELDGYEAIVAVPWIGVGGADLVALNYANALNETDEFRSRVAILTFHEPSKTDKKFTPVGVKLVQMPSHWRTLHPDLHPRLVANIVIQSAPRLVLAVNGFDIVEALKRFGKQMTQNTAVFASLFSWDRTKHGYPTNPITDSAEREHLGFLEALITDNPATASKLESGFGLGTEDVLVHLQPAPKVSLWRGRRTVSAVFDEHNPFKVIWPHRFDKEKRPDSLVLIAEEARARKLPIVFEAWGSSVLNNQKSTIFTKLKHSGVVYRGPYAGGLGGIPEIGEYDSLLLTSENEGIPLALVQAQLLGIPIVASSVGGVPHIVQDEETGLLAAGPDDISGFVDALERLMNDADLRFKLRKQGFEYASQNHSWHVFAERVKEDIVNPALRKSELKSSD